MCASDATRLGLRVTKGHCCAPVRQGSSRTDGLPPPQIPPNLAGNPAMAAAFRAAFEALTSPTAIHNLAAPQPQVLHSAARPLLRDDICSLQAASYCHNLDFFRQQLRSTLPYCCQQP